MLVVLRGLQPPLVVFILCLFTFGLTLMGLAYIVRETELPNPDITLDWNVFLEKLTGIKYCIPHSNLPPLPASNNGTTSTAGLRVVEKSMSALLPDLGYEEAEEESAENLTVSVYVPFHIQSSLSLPPILLTTELPADLLGQRGPGLHLSLGLPVGRELSDCKACPACLTLVGPARLLPRTRRPLQCLNVRTAAVPVTPVGLSGKCPHGSLVLRYTPNPQLTVMLSRQDRALVILRLLNTSYFLFGSAILLASSSLLGRFLPRQRHYDKGDV